MSEVLAQTNTVISSDIRNTGYGIPNIDFLDDKFSYTNEEIDGIITNPPFNISEDFIRKACSMDLNIVAFLLKSQYWHAAKRKKLFEQYPPSYILALTWRPDFLSGERGGAPTMECIWTVWLRNDSNTKYRLLSK